jgi:tetratricopeptide (TPR) repeat protein
VSAPTPVEAILAEASLAFARQRYDDAAAGYERCIALAPLQPAFHFNLGTAREKVGDLGGAVAAYLAACRLNPRDARLALFAGSALEAAGRREEAATLFSLGDDLDPAVRHAKDRPELDPEIRRRSATADRVMREHFSRLHQLAIDDFARAVAEPVPSQALARVRAAIWVQTHDRPFVYRTPAQRPSLFYVPDLPAREFTPREELSWAIDIEVHAAAIRDEYLAAVAGGAQHAPYVEAGARSPLWRELRGNPDWSALHLYKLAEPTALARLFPRTLAALAAADVLRIAGNPMELFFSRLKPGTHIPPHYGIANNRITVHLPLIVPGDCEIRVGNARHRWREGELVAFDDSFEHEAWNRAEADRVVLIFEAHHTDLAPPEREAIQYAIDARGRWLRERRVPAQ